MFTVCPKCSLKLVVTAADLRVAQGYVRCGRCTNVFNALVGLSDEQQAVLARESAEIEGAGAQAVTDRPARAPRSGAAEVTQRSRETRPGAAEVAQRADVTPRDESAADAALEFDPSQTDVSAIFVEPQLDSGDGTDSFESIVLRSEEEPAEPAAQATREPAQSAREPTGQPSREPAAQPAREPAAESARAAQAQAPTPRERPATGPSDTARAVAPSAVLPVNRLARDGELAPGKLLAQTGSRVAQPGTRGVPDPARAAQRTETRARSAAPTQSSAPPQPRRATQAPGAPGARPNAPPQGTPASPAMAASVQEFEFDPAMPAEPPAQGQGAPVVHLAQSSNPQRAAILREAAKRFIQNQRAARPAPAPRGASPKPNAPQSDVNSQVAADILGALGTADTREGQVAAAPTWQRRVMPAAIAVLGLILLAQITTHYRAALAEVGWLRPPLSAVYSAFGMPLARHWDVAAYEVHQLGAVAGEAQPGALTVRASIKNTASEAQPLPLLRVTVQDRFGNRVAARDIPPSAYLPAPSTARRELAAGQRVDAEVELADPGPSAVGFEVDACLEDSSGRIACANESSASSER